MEFGVFHLFCGIGGGALGFQQARGDWRGIEGRFVTLGGIDADSEACADFEALTGVRPTCMDLFDRASYAAFHGHEPPADWREATGADLRAATGERRPDVVFTSPPCKSFSGLLPGKTASSAAYRALSGLALRGVQLMLEAWGDAPPGLFILENVSRITSRGAPLLDEIQRLLRAAGYDVKDGHHDVGEVGGLGQHRRRYLMVARHRASVASFLYRPPQRKVRSIGSVIGPLPMPDAPEAGPLHRLPRLNWLTWVRLALIPAGGDWRDLQGVEPGSFSIRPIRTPHFNHVCAVTGWDGPSGAVTAGGGPWQGAPSVADPRLAHEPRRGVFGIVRWDRPSAAVTSACRAAGSNMPASVADPRVGWGGLQGVQEWDEAAATVTGTMRCGSGNVPAAVADPRMSDRPGRHLTKHRLEDWDGAAHTVAGSDRVGSGAPSVADPRRTMSGNAFHGSPDLFGVRGWGQPAATVTGTAQVSGSNTPAAVADPRTCACRSGAYGVVRWDDAAPAVTGSGDVHSQGAAAVADPRLPAPSEAGVWLIVAEDGTWHRPLTTLELATLQGFPPVMSDGRPLTLAGRSQARWRERIGNAVPPPAAEAVAGAMLQALIPSAVGMWTMSAFGTQVWVHGLSRVLVAAALRRKVSRR